MKFKNIYKANSLASKTGILFLLLFTSVILHLMLVVFLIVLFDGNGLHIIQKPDLSNQLCVDYLKLVQLFTSLGLFVTPILLYAHLTGFKLKFISLKMREILITILIMIFFTPFIALLLEWNMNILFPEWLLFFDKNSDTIVMAFLKMETLYDFFYTLLVIAVVPAIGEELIFRGYLQQSMERYFKSAHIAILVAALFFSFIHLELKAIIPRFVLGGLIGYLYYWSGSLWLPILAHFVNNVQAVVFSYSPFGFEGRAYFMLSESKVDPIIAVVSFFSTILLTYVLYKKLHLKKVSKRGLI